MRIYRDIRGAFGSIGLTTAFGVVMVALALAVGPPAARGDMIVNGSTAQVTEFNTDGSVNPSFWAKGYDLTSLGHDPETTLGGQWATLIQTTGGTPIVLSASHYWPQVSANWTNAAGQTFSYSIVGVAGNVGGTDLWIGKLTAPVDPSIHVVAIAPPAQVGQPILSVGYLYRAGQNTIAATQPGLLSWNYSATTPLSDLLQAWDSGGPTFIEEPGGLALAGVHDAISGTTSFDTNVTSLVPAINAALATAGINETVVVYTTPPTPEPSSIALVGIGLAAWYAVKRRPVAENGRT